MQWDIEVLPKLQRGLQMRFAFKTPARWPICMQAAHASPSGITIVAEVIRELDLASRREGVRLPRASGKSPDFPRSSPNFPEVFRRLPRSSLTVELNSNPEVPRKFPKLPRKFPKFPRKFSDLPGGQPLSLGSLTPSPDTQQLSLNID